MFKYEYPSEVDERFDPEEEVQIDDSPEIYNDLAGINYSGSGPAFFPERGIGGREIF